MSAALRHMNPSAERDDGLQFRSKTGIGLVKGYLRKGTKPRGMCARTDILERIACRLASQSPPCDTAQLKRHADGVAAREASERLVIRVCFTEPFLFAASIRLEMLRSPEGFAETGKSV